MHVTFWLTKGSPKEKALHLPRANLHLFQSLIYRILPPDQAAFLHEEGYDSHGKKLKLFAMSWPMASCLPAFDRSLIRFPLPVRLTVSSPLLAVASALANGVMEAGTLRLGKNKLSCDRVELTRNHAQGESLTVRTLSPVTCYEVMTRRGRPYTVYFRPDDREFAPFINANLKRKFSALFPDRPPPAGDVRVTPLDIRERVAFYRPDMSCPIKGWDGVFRLDGPEELLQTALDCGLGGKNSSGWGCVTPAEGKWAHSQSYDVIHKGSEKHEQDHDGDDLWD